MTLGFMEVPQDEQPPENIWHHTERLEEWFNAVRQRRENPDMQPVENVDDEEPVDGMMRNELTKELLG